MKFFVSCHKQKYNYMYMITVNPRFKPWGLINFIVHNHPGSNRERVEIETVDLLNLSM